LTAGRNGHFCMAPFGDLLDGDLREISIYAINYRCTALGRLG
jgi:hypothetical protein